MKPPVSAETRQQVLTLRRTQSIGAVAVATGLPVGTVKTICHRSGAFKDNAKLRELFTLPPIQTSPQTLPAVPQLPPQNTVTGDKEIDAVLWLREVIGTGQAALIEKAMLAVKKIKTPLVDLEKRYQEHLVSKNPGDWTVMFKTIGFADLEDLAKRSSRNLTLCNEATARFGDRETLYADTEAEQWCAKTLADVKHGKNGVFLDDEQVDKRFQACPELMPNTLGDCLYELAYWDDLYALRSAAGLGEPSDASTGREWFVFRCLARIRPRNPAEAIGVFRYLSDSDRMEMTGVDAILRNLIGGTA